MGKSTQRIFLFLTLTVLFVTGCGTTALYGESENWKGQYSGSKDDENVREFVITPKDNMEITVSVSYRIIFENNDIELEGTKHLDSNTLIITSRCSDCDIAFQSDEITIELEWDGNEESFVLSK